MPSFEAVSNATLPTAPRIAVVTIPASAANTYHFNLTVRNSSTGCVSTAVPVALTVQAAGANGPSCSTFTNKTTTDGLDITVNGVYAVGSTVYAATSTGLSISTDGGATFTKKTTTNGLGNNTVYGVYAVGTTVYAATAGGLSISTDGGTTFTNRTTTTNGLGNDNVLGVYAVGSTVYAATAGGLSISTDDGATFTNKTDPLQLDTNVWGVYALGTTVYWGTVSGLNISTDGGATFTKKSTTNGLGGNTVLGVYAVGTTVYAATDGGLSISTDGGATFTNRTSTTNGLGSNTVRGVYALGTTVYAATRGGLSISTDGGATFTNRTTTNGLGSNSVRGVYAVGTTVYAATGFGGVGGLSNCATLALGTPTNPTTCVPANGSIAFTSTGFAAGTKTLNYKKGGTAATPATVTVANDGTFTLSGLGAGAYTDFAIGAVTATGTNPTLTNPTYALTIGTPTHPTTCGGTDGKIAFNYGSNTIPDGTYSMSYSLGGNTFTKDVTFGNPIQRISAEATAIQTAFLTGLGAGSYSNFSITINGCTITPSGTTPVSLSDPTAPTLALRSKANLSSCSVSNGNIALNVPVSLLTQTVTLNYKKDGSAASASLTVQGTAGSPEIPCTPTTMPGPPGQPPIPGPCTGGTPGIPAQSYITLLNLGAGVYSDFSITTSTNCTSTSVIASQTLTAPAPTFSVGTVVKPTSCGSNTGSIPLTGLTANTSYSVSYQKGGATAVVGDISSNASGVLSIPNLGAGSYTNITVTLAGCTSAPRTATVSDPTYALAIGTPTNPTTCGGTNGKIAFNYGSNTIPDGTYSMSYSLGGNTFTKDVPFGIIGGRISAEASEGLTTYLEGLGAGSYSNFSITINGCTITPSGTAPVVLTAPVCCPNGNTLYVNASVSGGTGDGSSWTNAYASLSNALAVAHACNVVKTIKVAQGTYKPTKKPFNAGVEMSTTDGRDVTFHIPDGVTIEGGYNATGSRDIAANATILSGDIDNNDVLDANGKITSGNATNAYHVVLASAASTGGVGVTIDGFSITGGNANGSSGITVNGTSIPRVGGGGICTAFGTNTLSNNTLYNNTASYGGGGILTFHGTNTLSNNTLYNNTATNYGGGIYTFESTNTLSNNTLYNNTASLSGGGIYTYYGTNTLSNNTLYNNTANNNGGGICTAFGTNTLSNNIFWANKKGTDATVAGADYYVEGSNGNTFKNNLLQLAATNYPQTAAANSSAIGTGASGNIFAQDPGFVSTTNFAGADGKHRTADDGLALQISSPGINAGTTGTGIPTTDITGAARVGNPDMGAYEAVCTTPTFSVGTPTKPTTCGGTNSSIPLTGLAASTSYSVSYQQDGNSAVVSTLISNASGELTIGSLGAGSYTNITVTLSGCTSAPATASLANPPSAMASISGTTNVCQNAPSPLVTFTASNGTAPYTFSYRINGGTVQTLTTSSGSSSATLSQNTSTPGVFSYALESVNDAQSCGQNQTGSATLTVQGKPTISLNALQQTLNEGNNPVLCDTDADPVNNLQFNVSTNCVSGSPLWRSQVGNGAWSEWSATAPTTQASNNLPHRYQAACDANCPVTYSSPIELTINYRAAAPQNVSLVVDGVSIAAGQTKEVCSLVNTILTFNANCANGEIILYSVDGGEYSAGIPTGLLDNQFHNYRLRCRKAEATPSCVESESGLMRLKLVSIPPAPTVSLSATTSCDATASFSGQATCGTLRTIWYNATTNIALPTLPSTLPIQTTSYYARCQTDNGCVSEKSNVVTFTLAPTQVAPIITASQEIVCTGTTVTIAANCPAGSQTFWNTGVTAPSFQVAFSNVTKQSYFAKCIFDGGCQSAESIRKDIYWNAFVVTLINIGQSQSAIKTNNRNAWTNQFITPDNGPQLEQSTQQNPTIYYVENANKIAPRYWTVNVETCNLGTNGSLTFDMQAVPEMGVIRSYNTHENNAPYFMYANREGWTELYAQNHPAYGFYQDNGAGGNVYDTGLPKGLYKLGIRYWDMKGWGSIYPATRKSQGNVLAYQEYWFRIQSKDGVGIGAARVASDNNLSSRRDLNPLTFAEIMPNPVSSVLRLKVSDAKDQKVNISLMDASGRAMLQRSFIPETNTHQEEFNVSELTNGIYFLKVNAGEKQATLKVVKVQ